MPLPTPIPHRQQTPAPAADPIADALKAAELNYEDIGKYYKLRYNNSDTKRQQSVYIRKSVETYESISVREGYTLFYDSKDAPTSDQLIAVFQRRFTIGGVVLEAPSAAQPNWRLRFRIELPTDLTPIRLKQRLSLIQATGDDLERTFSPDKEDRF